jgi:hypothetical protein
MGTVVIHSNCLVVVVVVVVVVVAALALVANTCFCLSKYKSGEVHNVQAPLLINLLALCSQSSM